MSASPWSSRDRPSHAPGACVLRATGLHKRFASRVALNGLDLELHAGETVGLIGPNGSGKSTLLAILAGVLRPEAGSVQLGSAGPPTRRRVRRLLGMAPQATAIYPGLSAEQNVAFFGRLNGLSGRRVRESVERALQFVGLVERRSGPAQGLSLGMQRRLNLACAVVHDPPLLLLDEPTVGVDPHNRQQIMGNIRQLRNAGRSILYATHHMDEAKQLCDRLVIVHQGVVLAEGSPGSIVARHRGIDLEEVFLRLTEQVVAP